MKLLVVLFIIDIFARTNISGKHIGKKQEQFILLHVRSLKKEKKKYSKVNQDISFIRTCQRENLISVFAKLEQKLVRVILDTELQQKHNQKRKLKREAIK